MFRNILKTAGLLAFLMTISSECWAIWKVGFVNYTNGHVDVICKTASNGSEQRFDLWSYGQTKSFKNVSGAYGVKVKTDSSDWVNFGDYTDPDFGQIITLSISHDANGKLVINARGS